MIREQELYHGVALLRLVRECSDSLHIARWPDVGGSAYVVNNTAGLLIKYSTKRLSPWGFTFTPEQLEGLIALKNATKGVVVALVCQRDGIVGLTFEETSQLISMSSDRQVGISVSRRRRELYAVRGTLGGIDGKISEREYVRKVCTIIGVSALTEEEEGDG